MRPLNIWLMDRGEVSPADAEDVRREIEDGLCAGREVRVIFDGPFGFSSAFIRWVFADTDARRVTPFAFSPVYATYVREAQSYQFLAKFPRRNH